MDAAAVQTSLQIYIALYFGAIAAFAIWETLAPRAALRMPLRRRWFSNIGVALINGFLGRLLLPVLTIELAVTCAAMDWGLFNQVDVPLWAVATLSILLLDMSRYAEHVVLHRVPVLWRLHRMHHTDPDYDVTTSFRIHPVEALATSWISLGVVAALGPPVEAVVAFEFVFVVMAVAVHSNVRLPEHLDRLLRHFLVTPDVHRVHHSVNHSEFNRNFGAVSVWWDRLFGTFLASPACGHDALVFGIAGRRSIDDIALPRMLAEPLRTAHTPV